MKRQEKFLILIVAILCLTGMYWQPLRSWASMVIGSGATGGYTDIYVLPTSQDFGTITVGGYTSNAYTFNVTNAAAYTYSFGSLSYTDSNPGDWATNTNTCTGTINPNGTCNFTAKFSPTTTGARSATAQLSYKRPQSITWASSPAAMTVGDADQTLEGTHATASSGLTDTFSVAGGLSAICTIASNKLHAVGAGTCTAVSADQAGDATWWAAAQANSGSVTISAGGCSNTVTDSQATNNNYDYKPSGYWQSQSFTSGSAYTMCALDVILAYLTTTPTGTIAVEIYNDNSGSPGTSIGTATGTIDATTIAAHSSYTTKSVSFAGVSISNATKYHIVLKPSASGWTLIWRGNGSVSGQDMKYWNGSAWVSTEANWQCNFTAYK